MGIVWEAYHKGVPLLGVPENPSDKVEIPPTSNPKMREVTEVDG